MPLTWMGAGRWAIRGSPVAQDPTHVMDNQVLEPHEKSPCGGGDGEEVVCKVRCATIHVDRPILNDRVSVQYHQRQMKGEVRLTEAPIVQSPERHTVLPLSPE